jgi:hypothetical protein
MLEQLAGYTRQIIVISETPFGTIETPETVAKMNAELARYNTAAQGAAAAHGALFLDVWTPFTTAARCLPAGDETSGLWSDGVHLSELGDTVLLQQAEHLLTEHQIIDKLLDYSTPPKQTGPAPSKPPSSPTNSPPSADNLADRMVQAMIRITAGQRGTVGDSAKPTEAPPGTGVCRACPVHADADQLRRG